MDGSTLTAQEISRVVPTADVATGREKHKAERFPFECRQRLSHDIEASFPDPSTFYTVQCRDISQSGISFFLPTWPPFRCAVIEQGKPPTQSFWAIMVVRAMQEGDGRYLIGCSFTRQIEVK